MPVVARTAQHGITSVYLARKHHSVAIERKESILQLMESLEVLGPCHTDGRLAFVTIAPGDIITVFYEANTRVVAIHPFAHFGIVALKRQRFGMDIPMNGIFTEAHVQAHAAVRVVATEHSGITVTERHHGTVENTIGSRKQIARNDGIGRVAPHHFLRTDRTVFPRHVR